MSLVPVEQVGQVGIIKDVPPYSIPPNAWSDGNNVQFTDHGVQTIDGYAEVMKDCPIKVQHLVYYERPDLPDYWVAFGLNPGTSVGEIHCWNEFSHWNDITPGFSLDNSDAAIWSTTFLGVQLIATNGQDRILYWPLLEDGTISHEKPDGDEGDTQPNIFEPLPMDLQESVEEWENEEGRGLNPKTINAFKSILIGMNWPGGPTRVWWSSPGGHYSTPTWDWSNKDQDAGDYELNDTPGDVVDGAPLGEAFIIYKSDSIYIASYIGRPFIFGFKALSKDVGLLTKNALQEFPGGHIFMSKYDVHVTNGQEVSAILSDKLQAELFNDISGDHYHNAFISADHSANEAYICWPTGENVWCNRCIIWNWVTGAMSLRDIPELSDITEGVAKLSLGVDTWDEQVSVWDAIGRSWGYTAFESIHPELVMSSPPDQMIRRNGGGIHTLDGDPMESVVERTGMDLGDPGSVKKVNAIWPKITTNGNGTVNIWVCGQMSPGDPVHWEGPYEFDPTLQSKVSCRVTGKYFGWKIESTGYFKWRCHGVEFNVEPGGQRGSRVQ